MFAKTKTDPPRADAAGDPDDDEWVVGEAIPAVHA
jgi:hypothetical protein